MNKEYLPINMYDYTDEQLLEVIKVLYANIMTFSNVIENTYPRLASFLDNLLDYPEIEHDLDVDLCFDSYNAAYDKDKNVLIRFLFDKNNVRFFEFMYDDKNSYMRNGYIDESDIVVGKNLEHLLKQAKKLNS